MPTLLDLFCKAGGAAEGYQRAGFTRIVGVDHEPQPNYPFEFVQTDAVEYAESIPKEFDAVHASPPCQAYSSLARFNGSQHRHADLVGIIRYHLIRSRLPWVIENVVGSPLICPVVLCGSMFGLGVRRHRLFEVNFPVAQPPLCDHKRQGRTVAVYGHPGAYSMRDVMRGKRSSRSTVAIWRWAMGIDWMTSLELAQAIPPAYTEWIGQHLLATVARAQNDTEETSV